MLLSGSMLRMHNQSLLGFNGDYLGFSERGGTVPCSGALTPPAQAPLRIRIHVGTVNQRTGAAMLSWQAQQLLLIRFVLQQVAKLQAPAMLGVRSNLY